MSVASVGSTLLPDGHGLSDARRRVFEAAIVLFGARGYHAVSVRDIATQMGLKPMALYSHVASKQELLFEIMVLGHATHREAITDALLGAGSDPHEQIRALTRAHVRVHLDFPALARVTDRESSGLSDAQTEVVHRIRGEAMQAFLDVIERGQRLGAFSPGRPQLAVRAIAAMGILAADWWSPGADTTATEVADTYADFAVRLLT